MCISLFGRSTKFGVSKIKGRIDYEDEVDSSPGFNHTRDAQRSQEFVRGEGQPRLE